LGINTPAGPTGELRASGEITAFFSDQRLKENIVNIDDCLNRVLAMTGIFYTQNRVAEKYGYNDYSRQVGVIAQQIKPVAPEIIAPAPFDVDSEGKSISGEHFMTVKYERLVPIIVEAIKEQQQTIRSLMMKLGIDPDGE
jgi:hypothetical protein